MEIPADQFMGMEDDDPLFYQQFPVNSMFDEHCYASLASAFEEDLPYQSYSQPRVFDFKRPIGIGSSPLESKKLKHQSSWDSCLFTNQEAIFVKPEEDTWSPSSTLTFHHSESSSGSHKFVPKSYHGEKKLTNAQSRDHILAERKRREKLNERFVALSVLVPGLKKMDKASILGEAIKHMKVLQDKVKILEEQNKKRIIEKYEHTSSSSGKSVSNGPITLSEIEAKFCNNDVLINIHCEKRKGMLEKIVAEIEKLDLVVINSSIMSFGNSALNVTVIAQKDGEFALNTKEVVKRLRIALN